MQTAQTAPFQPNIFIDRDDTFFGICEAIGEDFGFHANWLRLALAVGTFFNPVAAVAVYVAMGVLVGITRWMVPNPALAEAEASADEPVEVAAPEQAAERVVKPEPMAEAA